MLKLLFKKPILISFIFIWSTLGCKRGFDYYDHSNPTIYLYRDRTLYGLMGSLFYVSPALSLFIINKEIYRLEVKLRNLEEEKTKKSYYDFY